jgi:hypothetical protein
VIIPVIDSYFPDGINVGSKADWCKIREQILNPQANGTTLMYSEHEDLKPWEKAFLGEVPLLTTSVFWQCLVGVVAALSQTYVTASQLRSQNPEQYSHWRLVFPLVVMFVLGLSWNLLAKASKIRILLRQNKGQPAYNDNLLWAQSLALTFFKITMALGLAMIIIRMILSRP